MSDSEKSDASTSPKTEEKIETFAPKYKLKKLIPKMENEGISEKEKARRERLSQQYKERHAKARADKEAFEKEQLAKIEKRMNVKVRVSKVKEKIKKMESESSSTDEETLNEYLNFKKFKQSKKKTSKIKNDTESEEEEEKQNDKVIQKAKKASQVLEAVNKLDQTITQLNGGYVNPYLAFFNSKK
jgi:hypothetical protein